MITLNYTLGVYPAYNGTVAKLSQYSNDFTLIFTLTNDYGDFVLEEGTTAQIRGTKADGNGYSANCAIDIEAQTVTVTGDEQITAAAGDNTFEIRLIKGGKILNTVNFTIWVERAALDAGTITSDSVLLELNAIIEGAQTATQAAASASASAEAAATSAATLRLDHTLTQSGESADAKVVGDALASGLAARYDSASPYAVGDYMLKDNVLYHVTHAIPAGGAVTVGTNVEIAPLGNAVTALNSKIPITFTVFNNRISVTSQNCFRVGNMVYINIRGKANQAFTENTMIQGLPTPSEPQYIPVNVSEAFVQITDSSSLGLIANGITSNAYFVISGVYFAG